VSGLNDNDAVHLWRTLQVSGSRQELLPIFHSVDNHPLLVQALASEVASYKRAPADFDRWLIDHPNFNPTSLPLVKSRTHILAFALQGLSDNVREALNTLVSFRMPTGYATLEAVLVKRRSWLPFRRMKRFRKPRELDQALTELEDRGLIGWDRESNRYDSHPIVRGVVWDSMNVRRKRAVLAALDAHFQPMPTPEWDQVKAIEDLSPAIERYCTLLHLKRFDDAFILFRERLEYATLYRLAAYRERISLLEPLFSGDTPMVETYAAQSYALSALAGSYRLVGQPLRAIPLYRRAVKISEVGRNEDDREVVLCNLGDALRQVGALCEAEVVLRQALIINRRLANRISEGITLQVLGELLSTIRSDQEGNDALMESLDIFREMDERQSEGVVSAILAQRALWDGKVEEGAIWANRAWDLAGYEKVERDFIRAALLQGQVALRQQKCANAEERLHHALVRARAVHLIELEVPSLIAIAELQFGLGKLADAKARIADAWEAAESGPYPLFQSDAQYVLAQIARKAGDSSGAVDAVRKAYRFAWCDGPPYSYRQGLINARLLLGAMNIPEPILPAFERTKFPSVPNVAIRGETANRENHEKGTREKQQSAQRRRFKGEDRDWEDYDQRGF
jgi:tetratricopeptide (TPR) repeat protein